MLVLSNRDFQGLWFHGSKYPMQYPNTGYTLHVISTFAYISNNTSCFDFKLGMKSLDGSEFMDSDSMVNPTIKSAGPTSNVFITYYSMI